jgi:hypothetical protein
MKPLWTTLCVLAAFAPVAAHADQTFAVGADSVVFSRSGSLVRVTETGSPGVTYLAYETATTVRVYAERSDTDGQWEVLDDGQDYCPLKAMYVGLTWRFLDDDLGNTRTATVVDYESVSVPAGTFMAYRADISVDDQPSVVTESLWFTVNVGMVRQLDFQDGAVVRRLVLQNYGVSVIDPGFFPLVQGNTWEYADESVETRPSSLSTLKGSFSTKN